MAMTPDWPRLSRRRAITVVIVLGVFVSVAAAFWTRHEQRSARAAAFQALASIAQIKAEAIAAWRGDLLGHARQLAESPLFAAAATGLLAPSVDSRLRQGVREQLELSRRLYGESAIFLARPGG